MVLIVAHGIMGTAYRQDIVVDGGAQGNGDVKVLHDLRRHISTQYGDGTPITGWALSPASSGMWLNRVERAFDANYAPAYLMVSVLIPRGQRLKDDTVLNKISRAMILNHSKFINQNVIQYECDWSFLKPLSQEIEGCLEPFDGAVSNYTDSTDGEVAYYDGDLSKMMREMWSDKFTRYGTVFCGWGLLSPDKEYQIVTAVEEQTKSTTKDIVQDEPIVEKQDASLNELKEDELNNEKAAFYRTKEIGTREAYNHYLETYPNGWFAEEARKMRDSMTLYGSPSIEETVQIEEMPKPTKQVSDNPRIHIEKRRKRLRQIILGVLVLFAAVILLLVLINRCNHESVDNYVVSTVFKVKGVTFSMNLVEGGCYMMGADSTDMVAKDWEKPSHSVVLDSFYIGETEVTQALWTAVMGTSVRRIYEDSGLSNSEYVPSSMEEGDNYPMFFVGWDDCQEFVEKLNQLTGKNFRLPTEAEWEFAAKGGIHSKGYKYAGSNSIDEVAWYWRNSGDKYLNGDYNDGSKEKNNCKMHPVKMKRPNELGLYDMTGNVNEWCSDWFNWYSSESAINPQGPDTCRSEKLEKVRRGGFFLQTENTSRVTYRIGTPAKRKMEWLGFRLALSATESN